MDINLSVRKKFINERGQIVEITDYDRLMDYPFQDKQGNSYSESGKGLSCADIVLEINLSLLNIIARAVAETN